MYSEITPRAALLWGGPDSEIRGVDVDVIGVDPDRNLMRIRHREGYEHNVNPDDIDFFASGGER